MKLDKKKHLDGRVFDNCLEHEQAFCTAICPFHLNTRDFCEKLSRGSIDTAFKTYRNAVGFPRIVAALCAAPCQVVCPLQTHGGAIKLSLLEQSTVGLASNTKPNNYNMPLKSAHIAVIGAGLSGLACALRLAEKKYKVTVFEQSNRIGGNLWQSPLEPRVFLEDIQEQFLFEDYELRLNIRVHDLAQVYKESFDALYVACGKGGNIFGLEASLEGAFASQMPAVFFGGEMAGRNCIEAIADGLQVTASIERYLKTGTMNQPFLPIHTKMQLDRSALHQKVIPQAVDGEYYNREGIIAEARRCLRCVCDACRRHCDLMDYYQKTPPRIGDEVAVTIYPATQDGNGTYAKRLIGTCNQCGLCKGVCPKGFDLGEFLLKSRRAMHQKGLLPWVFHDYWLRDLDHATSESAYLLRPPANGATTKQIFFPGCQLGASDPRYVEQSYKALQEAELATGLWLACCGAPAVWSGNQAKADSLFERLTQEWCAAGSPPLICACPTCMQILNRYLPQIPTLSLWSLLLKQNIRPKQALQGDYAIFDPCTSRDEPQMQQAVYSLAEKAGVSLHMVNSMGKCCSWGGHVAIANPSYTKRVIQKRINQSSLAYITYCVNCRDTFADAGKQAPHILDILFDLDDGTRLSPGCTARRQNRERLRQNLLQSIWQENTTAITSNSTTQFIMAEAMQKKLDDQLILKEEVQSVIMTCIGSGRYFQDNCNGHLHGYGQVGYNTVWVEFTQEEGGYMLYNAYSHRMEIQLEETWKGRKV